jgi:hypothetical protein
MNKLTFYEQVGIVIPGSMFLFGSMFFMPAVHDFFVKDGVSLGGLGIFVIVSYAAGQLVAGLGNAIESLYWRSKGGMPSNWIAGANPRLLSAAQIARVEALTASRLGVTISPLSTMNGSQWFPVFRQIYSDVERHGKPGRGDTFNGVYGLNRGLCAAALALAVAAFVFMPSEWWIGASLLGVSIAYLYRMQRFGIHYAREIYNQFLLLPPSAPSNARALGSRGSRKSSSAGTGS